MKKTILGLGLLASATGALGATGGIDGTKAAIDKALASFASDHPEHIEHFSGIKAWFEGANIKVRIYMHEGSMTYQCMDHGETGASQWMCHMQM